MPANAVRSFVVLAAIAVLLSAAALFAAVSRSGPAGPTGPRGPLGTAGQTGKSAQVAHLGLCWNFNTWSDGQAGLTTNDLLTAPVLTDGVPSCPDGQFVSIVPEGN
jgi:hypothetical protein